MKKHNTMKIILGCILLCAILTWIIPAAYYQSEFVDQGVIQMGLFDLFSYSLTSLSYFGYIGLYMIVVGGFYGILYKIPAYRNMLDRTAEKMKKHGMIYISLISIILAVLTSVCGLQFGLILFFPLIASLIILMGYDKITAALTLVGSTMIGVIGSTYASSNLSVLSSILGTKLSDDILVKVAILIGGLLILIINLVLYTKKFRTASIKTNKVVAEEVEKKVKEEVKVVEVKKEEKVDKDKKAATKTSTKSAAKSSTKTTAKSTSKAGTKSTKKTSTSKKTTSKSKNNNKAAALDDEVIAIKNTSNEDYLVPSEVADKKKIWPLVVGLLILCVILVLAFMPWSTAFGLDIMSKATEGVNGYKLFGFEIFAKLLGTYNTFGDWMITDMMLPIAFVTLLLVIIYRVKLNDVLEGFAEGAKRALGPATIVLLVYTILVINTYHPFQLTIYKAILGKGSSLNVITSSATSALAGILNVDPSYAFQSFVPYLISLVTNNEVYPIIAIIATAMYGFVMLFAPTSIILMGTLSYLDVSYKEWLKAVWKLLVELLIVLLIVFTILVLI